MVTCYYEMFKCSKKKQLPYSERCISAPAECALYCSHLGFIIWSSSKYLYFRYVNITLSLKVAGGNTNEVFFKMSLLAVVK